MNHEQGRNPYTPPGADLADLELTPGRRIGWKVYLWLMVTLSAIALALFGQSMQTADLAALAVTAVALVGLFGLAYRRRIGSRFFWRLWLPCEVVWDLAVVLVLTPAGLANQFPGTPTSAVEEVAGLAILLPLYVGLYRYAYRSRELWSATRHCS